MGQVNKAQRFCEFCHTPTEPDVYDCCPQAELAYITSPHAAHDSHTEHITTVVEAMRKEEDELRLRELERLAGSDRLKVLCVCRMGLVRSHAIKVAMLLRGHEAIAVGLHHHSDSTFDVLLQWCDVVIVADSWMVYALNERMPFNYVRPVLDLKLGHDVWRTRVNGDLLRKVQRAFRKERKRFPVTWQAALAGRGAALERPEDV